MNSKKEPAAEKPRRKRALSNQHSAAQKAQAVLAIWTERVKTAEVMRSLGVPYLTLQQWQERALEGMMQALEPRVNLADGAALSPRIRALLEKRQLPAGKTRLLARLEQMQKVAPPPETASTG
jgi:transposase-like protein